MISPAAMVHTNFYNIGGHLMYFAMISAHLCLFVDELPPQENTLNALGLVLATLAATFISSLAVDYFSFSSFSYEIIAGLVIVTVTSAIFTLFLQKIIGNQRHH